jgi:hypothetical protein
MATLSTRQRKALPASTFALPGRRYPIPDRSHAQNALARVSQHGTPAEKAVVRRKVQAKYPGMGKADPNHQSGGYDWRKP